MKSAGLTRRVVSKKLARLLCKASEDDLQLICHTILADVKSKASMDVTKKLVEKCIKTPTAVEVEELRNTKQAIWLESQTAESSHTDFETEETIVEVCWAWVMAETMLTKADRMVYQLTGFLRNDREEIFRHVFDQTLGWHGDWLESKGTRRGLSGIFEWVAWHF